MPIYAEVGGKARQPPRRGAQQPVMASVVRGLIADNDCLPNTADIALSIIIPVEAALAAIGSDRYRGATIFTKRSEEKAEPKLPGRQRANGMLWNLFGVGN